MRNLRFFPLLPDPIRHDAQHVGLHPGRRRGDRDAAHLVPQGDGVVAEDARVLIGLRLANAMVAGLYGPRGERRVKR